jgi:hypothetical protein
MVTQTASQWVGIDVSKAKLDIALRPANKTWQVSNPHSAGSSRDKVVFLAGRAKKGKNIFVIGGQINDSFNTVNL